MLLLLLLLYTYKNLHHINYERKEHNDVPICKHTYDSIIRSPAYTSLCISRGVVCCVYTVSQKRKIRCAHINTFSFCMLCMQNLYELVLMCMMNSLRLVSNIVFVCMQFHTVCDMVTRFFKFAL